MSRNFSPASQHFSIYCQTFKLPPEVQNWETLNFRKREGIRNFFAFLVVTIFVGFVLAGFFYYYSQTEGGHLWFCILMSLAWVIGIALTWAASVFVIRHVPTILKKTLKIDEESNPDKEAPLVKKINESQSPFRHKESEAIESFVVEYLKTHHERWQWGCPYVALSNSLLIGPNKKVFYSYITDRYPGLIPVQLRNFHGAVREVEDGARINNTDCEDEIKSISDALKSIA